MLDLGQLSCALVSTDSLDFQEAATFPLKLIKGHKDHRKISQFSTVLQSN